MDSNQLLIQSLSRQQVLVKTAKGWHEIETKELKLPAKLRRLLIMIDGQSTLGEILDRLATLGGDLEAQIMTLTAEGLLAPLQKGMAISRPGAFAANTVNRFAR